jgi:RNA polymerase-binding transcription factor
MDESTVRDALKKERAAAELRITAVTSEFDGIVADSQYANADDEHDPEGSTIAYERSRVAALIAGEKSHLEDLDRAIARLSSGDYGLCEGCGGQIAPERLAALPAVRTCFACAVTARSG